MPVSGLAALTLGYHLTGSCGYSGAGVLNSWPTDQVQPARLSKGLKIWQP